MSIKAGLQLACVVESASQTIARATSSYLQVQNKLCLMIKFTLIDLFDDPLCLLPIITHFLHKLSKGYGVISPFRDFHTIQAAKTFDFASSQAG